MDYFEFYGIDELFFIDQKKLKQQYLQISKENHPDFHIGNEEKYDEALEATSTNNIAYKSLQSFEKRVKYILTKHKLLEKDKNALSPAFLMQMMDVNEEVMDLQMEPNTEKAENLKGEIEQMALSYREKLEEVCKKADEYSPDRSNLLKEVKEIYLKQKYVLRLIESVDKFASL